MGDLILEMVVLSAAMRPDRAPIPLRMDDDCAEVTARAFVCGGVDAAAAVIEELMGGLGP